MLVEALDEDRQSTIENAYLLKDGGDDRCCTAGRINMQGHHGHPALLKERQVEVRTADFTELMVFKIPCNPHDLKDLPGSILNLDPLGKGVACGPIPPCQRFIDDDNTKGVLKILLSEVAPSQERYPHDAEIPRAHNVVFSLCPGRCGTSLCRADLRFHA